jgi:aminoglycoside phosphotransferase (APT) family kinase protein
MAGESWEPDEFPDRPDVHRQLGRFLAAMHERTHPGFGPVGGTLRPTTEYHDVALASARTTIDQGWPGNRDRIVEAMAAAEPELVSSSCALVMPDISANQFLFADGRLAGVVDLDSYVIGPIELELTIAEWCLTDHGAFADGYRSVRPLPRFEPFRAFHRASMMVNEEAVAGDVDRLFEENACFD